MVQSKKQTSSKPKFAEVIIGDKDAREMYEATNSRPRRNPYLKLNYPNGVTLMKHHPIVINCISFYLT